MHIGNVASEADIDIIKDIIKEYWDCFCERGCHRPILDYEFGIDTGDHTPVCCRKPSYGFHESKVIMQQIEKLLQNKWARKCGGPWGSMIVLAAKPHQEDMDDIEKFVWRMCVSYRALNRITKPFQFPIPRCDDSVYMLGNGSVKIFIITLDARQGYHQIVVRYCDQEKLAFFGPDDFKYCFTVMPFGPTNAPTFYTAMMRNFKEEWDCLFVERLQKLGSIAAEPIVAESISNIYVGKSKLVAGSRAIIDDILLWCSDKSLLLLYFRAVCDVFKKFRVSFKLSKCHFLADRVEYVGHDLLCDGNAPAASKFKLINDWKVPSSGQSLFSFIGLIAFYHKFAPYHGIRLRPLRKLLRTYFRQEIPVMAWSPSLLQLFDDLKRSITSSPVTARYDPDKPVFLKTDWSSEGMGWILMQPHNDEESINAVQLLLKGDNCLFDLTPEGARLRPIAFGSRACTPMEAKLHSFVGETACGRWAISQNKKFLWGTHFYWICDCMAVQEILEYSGNIHVICRWAQELLGYNFTVLHRPARMMADVDALSRRFGKLIATHLSIAAIMKTRDITNRPFAYDASTFESFSRLRKKPSPQPSGCCGWVPVVM